MSTLGLAPTILTSGKRSMRSDRAWLLSPPKFGAPQVTSVIWAALRQGPHSPLVNWLKPKEFFVTNLSS